MRPVDPFPPRGARRVLRALAPLEVRDAIDGDVLEKYRRALAESAPQWRARWWYRREVAVSAWALVTHGLRPGTGLSLATASMAGAMVPLAPQVVVAAFDPIYHLPAWYSGLLAANILVATLLAPGGGAVAARLAGTRSLAGPAGVAALLVVPPLMALWLYPQAEPLWARCAWIILVPAATMLGGWRYLVNEVAH